MCASLKLTEKQMLNALTRSNELNNKVVIQIIYIHVDTNGAILFIFEFVSLFMFSFLEFPIDSTAKIWLLERMRFFSFSLCAVSLWVDHHWASTSFNIANPTSVA